MHHLIASVRHQGEKVTVETKLDGVPAGSFSGLRSRLSSHVSTQPVRNRLKMVASFSENAADRQFELHKARIRLVKRSTPADDGWTDLFNGKDLTGWTPRNEGTWAVRDGAIAIDPARVTQHEFLWSAGSYDDFELRLQYRLMNEGLASVWLRTNLNATETPIGPSAILGWFAPPDATKGNVTGTLFAQVANPYKEIVLASPTEDQKKTLQQADRSRDWNELHVRCEGNRIVVKVNGVQTVDYTDTDSKLPRNGKLALYAPSYNKPSVEFRNIRIRELALPQVAKTTSTPASPGKPANKLPAGVLFVDEYDRPSYTKPDDAENTRHKWGIRDGVWFDETKDPAWYFGYLSGGPYPECSWEVNGRVVGDNPASRGAFVLHVLQSGRGLQVRIDGAGVLWIAPSSVTFENYSAGPWLGPITHRAIKPGGAAFNKVRLDIRKRRLEVFVNETAVTNSLEFDWDLTPASLAMGVDCQSPTVRMEHERVEVRELPKSAEPPTQEHTVRYYQSGAARLPDGTHAYEGAALRVVEATSGSAYPQWDMQSFQRTWTSDCQLLWNGPKTGDILSLDLPIEAAGEFQLVAGFTLAPDFGKFKFELDGQPLYGNKSIDLFDRQVQPAKPLSLGTITISPGKKRLTVTILGKNRASKGFNVGLDEIRLVPVR